MLDSIGGEDGSCRIRPSCPMNSSSDRPKRPQVHSIVAETERRCQSCRSLASGQTLSREIDRIG